MVNPKMFFYRVMRDFFEHVWVNPDAWLYWDRKVLALREEIARNGKV